MAMTNRAPTFSAGLPDHEVALRLRALVSAPGERQQKAAAAAELIRSTGDFRWIGLYDVLSDEICVIAWAGPSAPAHPRFSRSQGLSGAAVRARAPVVVQDVTNDPRYLTTIDGTKAEAIFPVFSADGSVVGTLDVESATVNAFTPPRERWLRDCTAALQPLWR
jgi:putative methionine-R-sulfoxide reductase with GAF domain